MKRYQVLFDKDRSLFIVYDWATDMYMGEWHSHNIAANTARELNAKAG